MEIKELLNKDILSKYKVRYPTSLFQPSPAEITYFLLKRRCPICVTKLKIDQKGNGRCVSVRKDKFFVSKATLAKYF